MIDQLQQMIDRLWLVSWQRWTLMAVAVLAAATASTICAIEAGHQTGIVVVLVIALAAGASASPDSHTALAAEAIVVWQWLASTDDVIDATVIPLALSLFVFHSVIALMAVTPISAVIDRSILQRWAARSGFVVLATIGMWILAVVMHERRAPGNAALTFVAFVTLAALIVATRLYAAPSEDEPSH
jgi:hypothetical protein